MGCEYCDKHSSSTNDCTATQKYRDSFCGVDLRPVKKGSNYTPPKKKRKRKVKH